MAIKKFYSNKNKAGWRFDAKQKKFWSWGFDIYLSSGKRKRESGFGTKQLAENAVSRIKISEKENKYDLQTRTFPLVSEVLEKRLHRIESAKEKTRSTRVFNIFASLIPARLRFDELQTKHLRLFADKRLSEVKPVSVHRELTCIASAINSAHRDFPELENFQTPRIPRPRIDRSRRERIITQDEVMKLLSELFANRKPDEKQFEYNRRIVAAQVFQMCLLTGARIGEIIAMRWEQIDFGAGVLQIVGTKTKFKSAKNVRYLSITPTIKQILISRKEADKFGNFVFSQTGRSVTKYHQILSDAAKRVGIKYGENVRGGFITHDARHTAVTRMLQAGIDLSTIGEITGHSDKNLILHYSHATHESRKEAINVLENFVIGQKKKAS